MFGWSKKKRGPPTRMEMLVKADRLRARRKYKKAAVEYRKLLAVDAHDADVHARLAGVLVKLKQSEPALAAFRGAAAAYEKRGFADRAVAMYTQAAWSFPKNAQLWESLGRIHHERGRRAESLKALNTGAWHLRKKKTRPEAIQLLGLAAAYEPLHVDTTVALCRLLKADGQREDASERLELLAGKVEGPAKKRARKAQFALFPGFGTLWRWLRA